MGTNKILEINNWANYRELRWPLNASGGECHRSDEDVIKHHHFILVDGSNLVKDIQALYHKNQDKTISKIVDTSPTPPKIVHLHFNGIDSNFSNIYKKKYLYGGKGIGNNEQGIIQPIQIDDQHRCTYDLRLEPSTSSPPPSPKDQEHTSNDP